MNTMNYKSYTARIEFDGCDNIFVGRVLGLRRIISFHGETVSELRHAFEIAVDDFLNDCKEQGIKPEKPASDNSFDKSMESEQCSSTLNAAISRNFAELSNALVKLTAHNELAKLDISYTGLSFFAIAQHALYNDVLSHVIRVLDEHKDAMSFWYVFRSNNELVSEVLHNKGLNFTALNCLSEKIKLIRNKTHFHIDRKFVTDPESVWEKADIDGLVLSEALLAMAQTLACIKYKLYGGVIETVTPYSGSDIPQILKAYKSADGLVQGA